MGPRTRSSKTPKCIEMVHVVSSAENRKLIALYLSRNFVLMDINTQGKNVPNCTLIVHVMMSYMRHKRNDVI